MIDEFDHSLPAYTMHVVFLVDTSVSMSGRKIEQLNKFMADAVELTEEIALKNEIRIPMRVIEFNTEAKWLFGDTYEGVEHIDWTPLHANTYGGTNTAAAVDLARSIMHRRIIGERNLKPVVVLVSDGLGTDPQKAIEAIEGLKYSLNPQIDKVRRIAVCVEGAYEDEIIAFASTGLTPVAWTGYLITDAESFDTSLVIGTEELVLFERLLYSASVYPKPASAYPEEYGPVITVIGEEDDWEE